MDSEFSRKITKEHLSREAFLYVRQSTLRQVFENTESTRRQYALRDRAMALGWPQEKIHVIDCDQGHSGASTADREGFQQLTAEVGMGRAGVVIGLEVSRLARNCSDWHRLLEICALADTLILDEDGIYNPGDFNDRLLLGLKGTMSEAELHTLRLRLRGGIINKARRGELRFRLPVGLVHDEGKVRVDPDSQIRDTVQFFFDSFRRTRSVLAVVRLFRSKGLLFPQRAQNGPQNGEVYWSPLCHSRALSVLHNPRYAGAYCYGRSRRRRGGTPLQRGKLPKDQWLVFLPEAYQGYISWKEYEENQHVIADNAQRFGKEREKGPPREGPALLQGIVLCGRCGRRMKVRYYGGAADRFSYVCASEAARTCVAVPGHAVDAAIASVLLEVVTPAALQAALDIQEELCSRKHEAESLRRQVVERARYDAELARRRYMRVDPDNRLVADALEAEWNAKLRLFRDAQDDFDQRQKEEASRLNGEQTQRVLQLASDFSRLWKDPAIPHVERKRMVRLLIEDVTLAKGDALSIQVRFRGGALRVLETPLPKGAPELRRTPEAIVQEIDRLLEHHTDTQIVAILNQKGLRTGTEKEFSVPSVRRIRMAYGLKTQRHRLHAAGLLTTPEMAAILGINRSTVNAWRRRGKLVGYRTNDHGACLYEPPSPELLKRSPLTSGSESVSRVKVPHEV
jgi:DNA invertase Pin-like site-specific DNA recombinase